ncbi:ABC transporter ATP-binding protein [Mycetocola lacteus]|uniref:ABC transporter ATP-binding protein n=1 Tax=Mycetocola lacteus TaxID=76637 RepID=A0A3L7AL51_9MICO|nr:ABC transporter ATP-binding protein [Mycetocola lacteus]RLP84510.1 ABC transporter ATP-binding protein [Mycetocola lacteus]
MKKATAAAGATSSTGAAAAQDPTQTAPAVPAAAEKAPEKTAPATESPATKTAATKTAATKTAATKSSATKTSATESPAAKSPATKSPATAPSASPTTTGAETTEDVLVVRGLTRHYGGTHAVDNLDLRVPTGTFSAIVGPNGAGKTTALSMITGLLRPDAGEILVNGVNVWEDPDRAKRTIGALPDRMRLFERLTGAQFLHYSGTLRGLSAATVRARIGDLAAAIGLTEALGRLVSDYSVGMRKKVALAAALIHSPRLLVLDEPFESVDPVSVDRLLTLLRNYVDHGGTVVLSSHGMELIERVCDHVSIIVSGTVLAQGTVAEVRGNGTLAERFAELSSPTDPAEGLEWLHSFSD